MKKPPVTHSPEIHAVFGRTFRDENIDRSVVLRFNERNKKK
ncbi:hypothetical protein QQ020_14230 [Fulvivirgaceae bacterium BMA12]|uniref:Uncharacterized protein n=1 Tax=Agaribacillus aureus TaxID=3051825 RepID=A0ABT8L651_9BACT|nr:hypothetical protein [Fulvivirgaceae bacterium BMA12]